MLKGCWHSTTRLTTVETSTGVRSNVETWEWCCDAAGRGRQSIRWTDGKTCTGPMAGSFSESNMLVMTDTSPCTGGRTMFRGRTECTRLSDSEATC